MTNKDIKDILIKAFPTLQSEDKEIIIKLNQACKHLNSALKLSVTDEKELKVNTEIEIAVDKLMVPQKYCTIYTDGSHHADGKGAYAFIVLDENNKLIHAESKAYEYTTNNRMELKAIIAVLGWVKENCADLDCVYIKSDSEYCIKTATIWIHNWIRTNSLNEKANSDLWQQFIDSKKKCKCEVKFNWVKGHGTDEHNIMCDKLANNAATKGPFEVDMANKIGKEIVK